MTYAIPIIQNMSNLQKQLNTIFAAIEAMQPGYGAALPTVGGQPDGRLFVLTTSQTLYQVQSGAWVAVDMVP